MFVPTNVNKSCGTFELIAFGFLLFLLTQQIISKYFVESWEMATKLGGNSAEIGAEVQTSTMGIQHTIHQKWI